VIFGVDQLDDVIEIKFEPLIEILYNILHILKITLFQSGVIIGSVLDALVIANQSELSTNCFLYNFHESAQLLYII